MGGGEAVGTGARLSLELLTEHRLGRKRILDTALASTLEAAGIRRLATYNVRDYACFPFLDLCDLDRRRERERVAVDGGAH